MNDTSPLFASLFSFLLIGSISATDIKNLGYNNGKTANFKYQ
jgi:hypothetical protein